MAVSVIKRVILCADGDSRDINLWSNIPFLLGVELECRGIELIRVNLQAPWLLRRLWRYTLGTRHKLRHWRTSVDFFRSRTNHWFTTRLLNQAVRCYGSPATLLINCSISAAPSCTTIPVVLLSDWSYHHFITERLASPAALPNNALQMTNSLPPPATLRYRVRMHPALAARSQT